MSEVIDYAPAIVNVIGANATERKLSVMYGASQEAALALVDQKGKLGKAAQRKVADGGRVAVANAAARGNFKPIAEVLAARTGKAMVVSSKASFESLPDLFEAQIMNIKGSKNGGYTTTKAGIQKMTPALSLALELKAYVIDVIADASAIAEARAAERRAQRAALES